MTGDVPPPPFGRALANAGDARTTPGLRAVQIVAGYSDSCARLSDATVRCWGTDHNHTAPGLAWDHPMRATAITAYGHVARLASGENHTCVWRDDGSMRCWGLPDAIPGDGIRPNVSIIAREEGFRDVTDVALDGRTPCLLHASGSVECIAIDDDSSVHSPPLLAAVGGLTEVRGIVAVGDSFAALTRDGGVFTWGSNDVDSRGRVVRQQEARRVPALPVSTAVFTWRTATCARDERGEVRCWGQLDPVGQIGSPLPGPTVIPELGGVEQVVAGTNHVCARLGDGTVSCWGSNEFGQLGTACTSTGYDRCTIGNTYGSGLPTVDHWWLCRRRPSRIPALRDIVDLAAARDHTCALRRDGRVFCWGSNQFGELGDGTTIDRDVPTEASLSLTVDAAAAALLPNLSTRSSLTACNEYRPLRRASGPLLAIQRPTVDPVQVTASVHRIVMRHLGLIARCHEQMLARDATFSQRVEVNFTIDSAGHALAPIVTSRTAVDSKLATCLSETVGQWSFPTMPTTGARVVVPIEFHPL